MGQDGKGKGEAAEQPERSAISFRNDPIGESFAINAAELALQFWPVPARRVRNHGICRIADGKALRDRSEEHTSELQSLMRISYAVFCLKKKTTTKNSHRSLTPKHQRTLHLKRIQRTKR